MRKQSSLPGFVALGVAAYSILFTLTQPLLNLHRRARPPFSEESQPTPDKPGRRSPVTPAKSGNSPERRYAYSIAEGEQIG